MPRIKRYLRSIVRTGDSGPSRSGALRLDMNEGLSGLPPFFIRKVFDDIDHKFLSMYPEYSNLVERIAMHSSIKPENICISNGSDAAIKYIFDSHISPGDKILLTDPSFAMYPLYCKMFNARAISISYNNDLSFPYERFVEEMKNGIKMAVIINPNNPTGSVLGHDELINIIEIAAKNDILIVVDEAYHYFYPHSVIKQVRKYKNLIVLRTFSKLCAIAAARLGYAAADKVIIEGIRKVRPTYDVNGVAVLLAERLLCNKTIIPELIKGVMSGKRYLVKKLKDAGIGHRAGYANFVLIECGEDVSVIQSRLKKDGILVHGRFSQPFLKKYLRVTVGNKSIMEKFWRSFIKIWNEL